MSNIPIQDITERLQAITVTATDSIPFNPSATARWGNLQLSVIPRYLFRVFTPRSDGSTTESWVESRDATSDREAATDDIFQTTSFIASAHSIADHLNWRQGERKDNLVSWTSSLLFAIHYVFYRHADRTDARRRDGSAMTDIKLCIIDTAKFEPQVFIRDMDLIGAFATTGHQDLNKLRNLRTGGLYYFGEYLSQGSLKIEDKCRIVSAEAMIEEGLLSLQSEFQASLQNIECGWAKEVLKVRQLLSDTHRLSVSLEQIRVAVRIAQLFGPGWRLPVAINLVGLLPGHIDSNIVKRALGDQRDFSDDERNECGMCTTNVVSYEEMPEVVRANRITQIIYADYRKMHTEGQKLTMPIILPTADRKLERLRQAESSLRQTIMSLSSLKNNASEWTDEERSQTLKRTDTLVFLSDALREMIQEELIESNANA